MDGSAQRWLLALLAGASTVWLFVTSERCMAQADIRKAVAIVRELRAYPDAPSLPEALAAKHPGVEVRWRHELVDRMYGEVHVFAELVGEDFEGERPDYTFIVRVADQRLTWGNEAAKDLIEEIRAGAPKGEDPDEAGDSP